MVYLKMYKEAVMAQFEVFPIMCLEGLRNTMKNLGLLGVPFEIQLGAF
jgi:hypothetical protein